MPLGFFAPDHLYAQGPRNKRPSTYHRFSQGHPSIGRSGFWRDQARWYGVAGQPDLSYGSRTSAFLSGSEICDDDLYVMINAFWQDLNFIVQEGAAENWLRVIDTSRNAPDDISKPEHLETLSSIRYKVAARSVVVLVRRRSDKVETPG
jgi:isoamylase